MSSLPNSSRKSPVDTSGPRPVIHLGGETIGCVGRVAPGAFLDIAAASEHEDNLGAQAAAFQRFLFAVVAKKEEKKLAALLDRKEDPDEEQEPLDLEDLGLVVEKLAEWYAARPTKTLSGSRAGRDNTTATLTAVSALPDSTPQPSLSAKHVNFKTGIVEVSTPEDT